MTITAHHTVAQFTHCTYQLKVNPSTKYKVMIKRYGPIVLTKTTYQRAGEHCMQQNTRTRTMSREYYQTRMYANTETLYM